MKSLFVLCFLLLSACGAKSKASIETLPTAKLEVPSSLLDCKESKPIVPKTITDSTVAVLIIEYEKHSRLCISDAESVKKLLNAQ